MRRRDPAPRRRARARDRADAADPSRAKVPGLYKIFDEIVVNAADNKQRDPTMTTIKVTIDREAGSLSVWNDGHGIPVVEHAEHGVYVPELIFGHLLTGSNFDDEQKMTTGGRNG